jgi:uncharacterized protein (DUF2236 family)
MLAYALMGTPLTSIEFERKLYALAERVADPVAGFFGPDSVTWRINRDSVTYVGGLRALLMQVAHPKVAQGVADHSDYRQDPFGRLFRTFDTVHDLVFGNLETSMTAATRLHKIHQRVVGELPEPVVWPHTRRYVANDPDLLRWVYATLVDSAIVTHRLFLPDLEPEQWERYYQESKIFGELCGVSLDDLPDTLANFRAWMRRTVEGPTLQIGDPAREIAEAIIKGPPIMYPLRPSNYVLAAGMLPGRIRQGFGLRWSLPVRLSYTFGVHAMRRVVRNVPLTLRSLPVARRAERRCAEPLRRAA